MSWVGCGSWGQRRGSRDSRLYLVQDSLGMSRHMSKGDRSTRFPTFPICVTSTIIRSANVCSSISVGTPSRSRESCRGVIMAILLLWKDEDHFCQGRNSVRLKCTSAPYSATLFTDIPNTILVLIEKYNVPGCEGRIYVAI